MGSHPGIAPSARCDAQRTAELIRADKPSVRAIDPAAIYTVAECAELVGLGEQTIRRRLGDGLMQGKRRHGGQWRVLGSELLKLA